MVAKRQIDEIVSRIAENYNPKMIILFGSYASGNTTEDSDIDIIIVKDTDLPKHKRGIEVKRLFFGTPIPLDFKIYTSKEFNNERSNKYSFLNSALLGSKVLYEHHA